LVPPWRDDSCRCSGNPVADPGLGGDASLAQGVLRVARGGHTHGGAMEGHAPSWPTAGEHGRDGAWPSRAHVTRGVLVQAPKQGAALPGLTRPGATDRLQPSAWSYEKRYARGPHGAHLCAWVYLPAWCARRLGRRALAV
jgi:hypothetical protein